uniref:Chemokine interleukin-8-like domain-containing protein n=1 Tax=Cyprinodon variegatus TaxID=28743 RepID=A0A3Q2G5A8_CYPVA
ASVLLLSTGQPAYRSNKCKCSHSLLSRVKLRSIQKEPVVYQPSTFCTQYEIIVKVADKEKCLDPKSHIGQLILNRHKNKLRKTEAVQTTTAPAQSSTTKQATSRQ